MNHTPLMNKMQYQALLREFDFLVESGIDDERLEEVRDLLMLINGRKKDESSRVSKSK